MMIFQNENPSINDYIAMFDRFSPGEREVVLDQLQRKLDISTDETDNRRGDEISLDEICGGWADDERSTEEIIRDIYESRTFGREREPL